MTGGFTGGALSFKGQKKAKKKKSKSKHKTDKSPPAQQQKEQDQAASTADNYHDELTPAERKALVRKKEREQKDLEKLAQKSHRENIEEYNEKLGNLTEHNDIPRVSAAGNG
mmetsp:Transcript_15230/g.42152  ORF Transcript_15230/g.42152 Transcript_15230/m.42152 type:complete len:112 (+) Transcript_15230:119-454(+)